MVIPLDKIKTVIRMSDLALMTQKCIQDKLNIQADDGAYLMSDITAVIGEPNISDMQFNSFLREMSLEELQGVLAVMYLGRDNDKNEVIICDVERHHKEKDSIIDVLDEKQKELSKYLTAGLMKYENDS